MEGLYKKGVAKSIGVSNFSKAHLVDLMSHCEVKPMINQIEFHPYCQDHELVDFCRKEGIVIESCKFGF